MRSAGLAPIFHSVCFALLLAVPRQRLNILPNRIMVRKDLPAHLILLDWRKTILVASQFFAFLHSLGHKRPIHGVRAMSVLRPNSARITASH